VPRRWQFVERFAFVTSGAKARHGKRAVIAALKRVRQNLFRPCGTRSPLPLYPALPCRAILCRPVRGWDLLTAFHLFARNLVLTHTLKRCASQNQGSGLL
jgi:hypothetical protein